MNISIIIVHWNTPDTLRTQLKILGASKHIDIHVVDNNSDHTIQQDEFPHVHWINSKTNMGYAGGCNRGAVDAHGEWLLFLNPDTHIHPKDIENMCLVAESLKASACSPLPTTSRYRKPLPTPASLVQEFTPLHRFFPSRDTTTAPHDEFVFTPSRRYTLFGGGLLIRRSVFMELGGWDERFFLWFEDSDLTQRLITAGHTIGWIKMPMKHAGGSSFSHVSDDVQKHLFFTSMDIYARKHFGFLGQQVVSTLVRRFRPLHLADSSTDGVSISIPNMKKEQLQWFLETQSEHLGETDEVICITSALSHTELWKARKAHPHIRFVAIDTNRGFAHTVNIGFRRSTRSWIGTLNDDIDLSNTHKKWTRVLTASAHPSTGSVNPCIHRPNGEVESCGISIESKGKAHPVTTISPSTTSTVQATNGAAVLYARKALQEVGIFDEAFGSYLEDIDLSLRLTANGWKNIVNTEIALTHTGQQTSYLLGREKRWLDVKNWIRVIVKNWSLRDIITHFPAILLERARNMSGYLKY